MKSNAIQPTAPTDPAEPRSLPDAALVTRVLQGDSAAFELIMRRHNQRLYRIARGILRNNAEAEDAIQETYLRAYEKLGDFTGPDGLAAWLGRIAINESLGRLRKQGRVLLFDDYTAAGHAVSGPLKHDTLETSLPDPERLAASTELRRLLERAIDALPDDFRAVFILRAVDGLSVTETAQFLSIREETVKTRFHRARHLTRRHLGNQFEALMPAIYAFGGAHCDRIVAAVLARLTPGP